MSTAPEALKPQTYEDAVKKIGRVGAFAPGNYWSRCLSCGTTFDGDKRAISCLPCAVAALQARAPAPGVEREDVARVLRRFRLVRCPDHWRLFRDEQRIDGPWSDADVELADEALSLAQTDAILAMLPQKEGWRPIETAPKQALLTAPYPTGNAWSDVYHCWRDPHRKHGWERWPHNFPPTRWQPLPAPPAHEGGEA